MSGNDSSCTAPDQKSDAVEYRDIPGFPGYRAGSDGSVWSCWSRARPSRLTSRWFQMRLTLRDDGRVGVVLRRGGKPFSRMVCRLVLTAFVGECPDGMEACHFPDATPSNNAISNLRWGTKSDNALDKNRLMREQGIQKCIICKCVKPFDDFNSNRNMPSGKSKYCRQCNSIQMKLYRQKKKELV